MSLMRCFRCSETDMISQIGPGSFACAECGHTWTVRAAPTPVTAARTFDGKPACVRCGEEPALTTKKGRPNCGGLGANCYYTKPAGA